MIISLLLFFTSFSPFSKQKFFHEGTFLSLILYESFFCSFNPGCVKLTQLYQLFVLFGIHWKVEREREKSTLTPLALELLTKTTAVISKCVQEEEKRRKRRRVEGMLCYVNIFSPPSLSPPDHRRDFQLMTENLFVS